MSQSAYHCHLDWYNGARQGFIARTSDQHFFVTDDEPHPIKAMVVDAYALSLFDFAALRLQTPELTGGALFSDTGSKEVWHR